MFWGQRARNNWLRKGDRNTKFFHASTVQRMHRNRISHLKDRNGVWIEEGGALNSHIRSFFRDLFTAAEHLNNNVMPTDLPKVVTPEMNSELTGPVLEKEIKEAVFNLGPDKSPGPDGFSGNFYRKYWDIIGPQICKEVIGFFQHAKMPRGWNDTHIVIIPKVPHPEEISQFRPISCCNFNYKIISKIMSSRLKKWIPRIVSEMQAAFTSGRAIQDNIMIVHEVMHHFKTRSGKFNWDMMIKMDMKKAYDMVDWKGLDGILKAMGFNRIWCKWIEECIQTVRFSVLINGNPTDNFEPTRGIRQGDPISPFLFIILTNSLSFLLEKGIQEGKLKGLQLNKRCPTLTHVLFADDTIIFGEASVRDAINIKETMEKYANLTGQTINNEKSAIMFSRHTPQPLKERVKGCLGLQSTIQFGKYLGVPSEWGRSKKEVFHYLIERMENLGQSWKSLSLSHGGKETLLKAVYQSIPTYIMSCFLLPKDLTNKMDARLSAFFWGGTMTRKKIHWTKASILTKPKREGGLGFKNFRIFNKALLAKQGWRIITNPNQTWVRLLKGLYFTNSTFLQAEKGKNASWIWASICEAREVLSIGMRKNIMNGATTLAFQDPWIPSTQNFRIANGSSDNNTAVSEWINEETGEWNREAIERSGITHEVEEILKIPIGPKDSEDYWIWHHDKRGVYSVKSGYQELRRAAMERDIDRLGHINAKTWNWIWNIPIPPKFLFFIWRASRNALATKLNLWTQKCAPSPNCPLCEEEEESSNHCLFGCCVARQVWEKLCPRFTAPENGETVVEWLETGKIGPQSWNIPKRIAILWNIWKARNEKVFNDVAPNAEVISHNAVRTHEEWSQCNRDSGNISRPPVQAPIPCPPPNASSHQRIYCDGSFEPESSEAGYGVVCIDTHGQAIDGTAGRILCSSAMVAEAKGLLEAIRMAEKSTARTMIHSDCQILVQALQGRKEEWPWQCFAWLLQMRGILLAHDRISLTFVPRGQNKKADWIAGMARRNILPHNWLHIVNSSEELYDLCP
ncbi:LINE-1 retrotransposable element ORF2 protein [Linum perenne]